MNNYGMNYGMGNSYYPYYGAANNFGVQPTNFNNQYMQQPQVMPQGFGAGSKDFRNTLSAFDGYYVDNYQDVKHAIVSADGTPSVFISNNEDKFWIKKINSEDGRTIVKSFSFSEIFEDASAKKENQTIANATSINNVIEQKVNELINVNNVLINKLQNLEDRVHAVEATKQQVPIQQTKVDSKTSGGGQVNNGKQQSQQSFKNDF